MKCDKCGFENFENAEYCQECGNNLKSLLKTGTFNIKAILLGIIILFFALIIRSLLHFDTLFLWTLFMISSFFISGIITSYGANRLYIHSAILNGLVVGVIFSIIIFLGISYQDPVLYGFTYVILLAMVIIASIGGGVGGYLRIQRGIKEYPKDNKREW
jgi:peptidoglycan/LPS O-acetylase OafA/YrhL